MVRYALSTPASVIHIVDPQLCFIGVLHKKKFKSQLVLDLPERPGKLVARGWLNSKLSWLEPAILRVFRSQVALATVVVPSDVPAVEDLGYRQVGLVRNCPLSSWRARYIPPPAGRRSAFRRYLSDRSWNTGVTNGPRRNC